MIKATAHLQRHRITGAPIDRIALGHDERYLRRRVLAFASGREILVDLPQAIALAHGDGLSLEEGGFVLIEAAPEQLLKVTASSPLHLLELAWHLGNRHLPTELRSDHILIVEDPVMAAMLEGLGARLEKITAPFSPVRGAYHSHHAAAPAEHVHPAPPGHPGAHTHE